MNRLIFLIICFVFSGSALAAGAGQATSLGQAANNVNDLLMSLSGIIEAVFYVAGAVVICSAGMKYRIHRQTPQQVPISTVFTELILGIILLCVPTVTKMTNEHLFTEGDPVQSQGAGSRALNQGATSSSGNTVAPARQTPRR